MKNKFKHFFGEILPPAVPIALAIALGVVGCKGATQDTDNYPDSTTTIERLQDRFAVHDDAHPQADKDPLSLEQARKRVAQDTSMTKGGGYWVGGYVEDGVTHYAGGGDIQNPDTYLTVGQSATLYDYTLRKKQDPNVATHRSVAHSIEMYGTHTQQIKLALAQRAITNNIKAWNAAGKALETSSQLDTAEDLEQANAVTHNMLRQLRDGLPKSDKIDND